MVTITEDYVSFEIAKLLKEKGFNGLCNAYYDCFTTDNFHSGYEPTDFNSIDTKIRNIVAAPTFQMAMKWLREKHLLHISIEMMNGGRWEYEIDDISVPFDGGVIPKYCCDKTFSNYEKAADDAIKHCLKNLI